MRGWVLPAVGSLLPWHDEASAAEGDPADLEQSELADALVAQLRILMGLQPLSTPTTADGVDPYEVAALQLGSTASS